MAKYLMLLMLVLLLVNRSAAKMENNVNRRQCDATPTSKEDCPKYNILSIDAASYKGYITAKFIDYMERTAYYEARAQYCIPERESERIAMPELFDMIAGSESGALIAGALVVPANETQQDDQINRWFANDTMRHFMEHSE